MADMQMRIEHPIFNPIDIYIGQTLRLIQRDASISIPVEKIPFIIKLLQEYQASIESTSPPSK